MSITFLYKKLRTIIYYRKIVNNTSANMKDPLLKMTVDILYLISTPLCKKSKS